MLRKILSLLLLLTSFLMQEALAGQIEKITSEIPGMQGTSTNAYQSWQQSINMLDTKYFKLNNMVINPACIAALMPGPQNDAYIRSIDLSLCQRKENDRHVRIRNFASPPRKLNTYVEYDYNNKNMKDGFFGYAYIGESTNDIIVLNTYDNGGGTAYFTRLLLFKMSTDNQKNIVLTRVGEITGGDRCAGGIVSAHIEGTMLTVEKNIYETSAISCTQTKQMQFDLSKPLVEKK